MNKTVQLLGSVGTLLVILGGIVYNLATMQAGVSENKAAIAERKLSGKTVRQHGNRLTELETHVKHFELVHAYSITKDTTQDETIEDIRERVRDIEKGK